MPQLIAMVIVVIGAMIYMFQTFGGTADKIEGIAHKQDIITEIYNIKNGLQTALRSGIIVNTSITEDLSQNIVTSLSGIGKLNFFSEQINNQLKNPNINKENTYQAILFGGKGNRTLEISLVLPKESTISNETAKPGLFVDFSKGSLKNNVEFLEKELKSDLSILSTIDAHATDARYKVLDIDGELIEPRSATGTDNDGMFVIYFKDLPTGMIK